MVESLRRFDPGLAALDRAGGRRGNRPVPSSASTTTTRPCPFLDFAAASGARSWCRSSTRCGSRRSRARAAGRQLRGRRHRGRELGRAPAAAFVAWDDLSARLERAPRLEALSVEGDTAAAGVRQVRSQPAAEFHGRVHEWVADVRQARERGDDGAVPRREPGPRRARRSRSCASTSSWPCRWTAPRTRTPRRCSWAWAPCRAASASSTPALQVYVERDVFDEERHAVERRSGVAKTFLSDLRDLKVGDLVVHVDHGIGEFVGLKQLGVRGSDGRAGVPRAALPRRRQAVRAGRAAGPDPEVHRRHAAGARSAGRHHVGEGQVARPQGHARHGRGAAEAVRAAQGRGRARVLAGHALAGGVRGRVSLRADPGPGHVDRRRQARHGVADADGPAAVRRRRLRQDRSGDARGVQGGDGRQAGGDPGADDRAGVPAQQDADRALRRLPGVHRHGQPVPHQAGDDGDPGRPPPKASSTSWSARTGSCRRTCGSAIWAC